MPLPLQLIFQSCSCCGSFAPGLSPASFHAVICVEVPEHVEELIPALRGLEEVHTLASYLIAKVADPQRPAGAPVEVDLAE